MVVDVGNKKCHKPTMTGDGLYMVIPYKLYHPFMVVFGGMVYCWVATLIDADWILLIRWVGSKLFLQVD